MELIKKKREGISSSIGYMYDCGETRFHTFYTSENSTFHPESRKLHSRRMMNTHLLLNSLFCRSIIKKLLERQLKMQFVN